MKKLTLPSTLLMATVSTTAFALDLEPIGVFETGIFDEGAAEIVDFHPASQQLFIVNGDLPGINIVDLSDPTTPSLISSIQVGAEEGIQSVAVSDKLIAAAISAGIETDPGRIAFFDIDGNPVASVTVGSLPDMVAFSPDGSFVLCANEGEPSDDYTIDPEGSVSMIRIPSDLSADFPEAITLDFSAFTEAPPGIHQGNPESSLSQNLEPEYIAISPDGTMAMVALQESNAVALIDTSIPEITQLVGLGHKDHSVHPLDASNKDDAINIQPWPVFGLYQPDTIAAFEVDGTLYFATANEGDARDYDGWSEEVRVRDLTLDPKAFPDAAELQKDENLGRLKTTTAMGDDDGDGDHDRIFSYGGRSFSILDSEGTMIYDSGSILEEKLARIIPDDFNSNNDENDSFDSRSDDKGPEPEALTVAEIDGTPILFLGLERVGGIAAFDVSNPEAPTWLGYFTTRDFSGNAENGTAGDLAPESILFIPEGSSPNGEPLLVVANEVSGTTRIFHIVP